MGKTEAQRGDTLAENSPNLYQDPSWYGSCLSSVLIYTLLQSHWPPCCFSKPPSSFPPQGLCTGCFLCLEHSPPARFSLDCVLAIVQISAQMSPPWGGHSTRVLPLISYNIYQLPTAPMITIGTYPRFLNFIYLF